MQTVCLFQMWHSWNSIQLFKLLSMCVFLFCPWPLPLLILPLWAESMMGDGRLGIRAQSGPQSLLPKSFGEALQPLKPDHNLPDASRICSHEIIHLTVLTHLILTATVGKQTSHVWDTCFAHMYRLKDSHLLCNQNNFFLFKGPVCRQFNPIRSRLISRQPLGANQVCQFTYLQVGPAYIN